ncbi:MAG: hypothetical protein P8Y74_16330, partial [Desulfobacterales bacterium]
KIGASGKEGRSNRVGLMVLVAGVCVAAVTGYYFFRKGAGADRSEDPIAATQPTAAQDAAHGFQPLIGRWRRPDGGYVIEVRGIDADGKIDAGYFNPRPINVARAEASRDVDGLKVFIELRDVGYPGATYSLIYNPRQNILQGLYYQPTAGQTFEVVFVPLD